MARKRKDTVGMTGKLIGFLLLVVLAFVLWMIARWALASFASEVIKTVK